MDSYDEETMDKRIETYDDGFAEDGEGTVEDITGESAE